MIRSAPVLVWAAIVLAGGLAGRFLLRRSWRHLDGWERCLFSFAFGLGALALTILALGLAGHLAPSALWMACFLWASLGVLGGPQWLRPRWPRQPNAWEWAAAGLLAGCLTLFALAAGAPPVAFDPQIYHLAMPKLYLHDGAIHFLPFMSTSELPQLMEMLFTLGLGLSGRGQVAQWLHWTMGALTLALTYRMGARRSPWVGIAAALLLCGLPVFKVLSVTAKTDLAITFYSLLAVYSLIRYQETRRIQWIIFGGLAAGLGAGVKTMGFFWFFAFTALLLGLHRPFRRAFFPLLAFSAAFGAAVLPWLLRSYWETGNPVWPFAHGIFGGPYWDAEVGRRLALYSTEHVSRGSWAADAVAKLGELFAFRGTDFNTGPLLAAFLAAAIFRRRIWKERRLELGFVGLCLGIYLAFLPRSARYAMPAFPLMCLFLAGALWEAWRNTARWRAPILAFFAVWMWNGGSLSDASLWRKTRMALSRNSEEAYLESTLNIYPAIRWINRTLPADCRILLLNDIRGYYLDRDYLWGNAFNQKFVNYDDVQTTEDLYRLWESHHVTHVLFQGPELFWPAPGAQALEAFLKSARPLAVINGFIIYALDAT